MKSMLTLVFAVGLAGSSLADGGALRRYLVVNLAERVRARAVAYRDEPPTGGWTYADKTTNMVFRLCEPGTFRMGRSDGEEPTLFNSLPHDVTFTRPFYFAVFPVTQWQFKELVGRNPSVLRRPDCAATRPVDSVSWHDAKAAAAALARRLGRGGFDLPTSAQWEYAARAGERGRVFPGGPLLYGRFDENGDKSKRRKGLVGGQFLAFLGPEDGMAPVGSYRPNAWGIYDTLGNCMEWCRDGERVCGSPNGEPETDPAWDELSGNGNRRVLRGDIWWGHAAASSLSSGYAERARESSPAYGCRLVWNPAEPPLPSPPPAVSRTLGARDGSVAFGFVLRDGQAAGFDLRFAAADAPAVRVKVTPGAQLLRDGWCAYRYRRHQGGLICATEVPDSKVVFAAGKEPWFNFEYMLLPFFDGSRWEGVYDYERVVRDLPAWREAATPLREREFRVELRHDPSADRIDAYVDGQFAGSAAGRGGVAEVTFTGPAATVGSFREAALTATGLASSDRFRPLEPRTDARRTNPLLRSGATLALSPSATNDVPLRAWRPEESFDQGLHVETCAHDDIMYDGMLNVDGFRNGPEFLQYTLPRRPWSAAWVLCCPLRRTTGAFSMQLGGDNVTGVEFGHYGSTRGKLAVTTSDLPLTGAGRRDADALTNRFRRVVGTVTFRDLDGGLREAPLWLVRQRLDYGHVFAYETNRPFGLGFVGGGTWDGSRRSNVQVLGCTLEMSPVDFAVEETVRGNVFADGDRAETAVRLTAMRDGVKGRLEWTVRDPSFRELKRGAWEWSFARAGETRRFALDLSEWGEGWYALDWRVVDAEGVEQIAHEAAFTQLGRDTREAGFESPYAAWPQLGRHETNPNRAEQLAMLHKAGYHKGWHEAVTNESEYPAYRYTFTEYCAKLDGIGKVNEKTTDAELERMFEKDIEGYRRLKAKFPHLNTISIFHEDEPRFVAHELRGEFEPECMGDFPPPGFQVRNGWRTRYLTAFCRCMHRTFPGVRLRVANNSAASERVARLARSGFDLNLVDELGSEVLAFRAMPELAADQAAPGTMWALRETGRRFGMTNALIGASSEFVFRPERRVNRADPNHGRIVAYAVRDYLVALGHGCPYVSSGHLEDCFSAYYDSDWGASGQCRPYPLSYPKRIYTAIATLTKVLDRPVFSRRVPTGENTAYALEFRRDRSTPDFAYALWTPTFDVALELEFPAGASLRLVDAYGAEEPAAGGKLALVAGEMPRYVIASAPVVRATVTGHPVREIPGSRPAHQRLRPFDDGNLAWRLARPTREWLPSVEYAVPGTFENAVVGDPERGEVLVCGLVTNGTDCAQIFSEFQFVKFRQPKPLPDLDQGLGVWVRGNGGFGRVGFVVQKSCGDTFRGDSRVLWVGNRGFVDFHGWQFLTTPLKSPDSRLSVSGYKLVGVIVGSARTALDPLEMQPVTEPIALGGIFVDPAVKVVRNPDDDWVTDRQERRLPGWF